MSTRPTAAPESTTLERQLMDAAQELKQQKENDRNPVLVQHRIYASTEIRLAKQVMGQLGEKLLPLLGTIREVCIPFDPSNPYEVFRLDAHHPSLIILMNGSALPLDFQNRLASDPIIYSAPMIVLVSTDPKGLVASGAWSSSFYRACRHSVIQ